MNGIDLNCDIKYIDAAMRYFEKGEYHITRQEPIDVLVMVLKGILRFSEDGIEYEVLPGQYHIQKAGSFQTAEKASDSPEYLYVHFYASWADGVGCLSKSGTFNPHRLTQDMEALARVARVGTKLEAAALFYGILASLYTEKRADRPAEKMASYISEHYKDGVTLSELAEKFNFSKNYVINIFKSEFCVTPVEYITNVKLKEAMKLLSETSYTLENIAYECGFGDYSHFYKVFRRENGISPKKWRNIRHI